MRQVACEQALTGLFSGALLACELGQPLAPPLKTQPGQCLGLSEQKKGDYADLLENNQSLSPRSSRGDSLVNCQT